MAAARNDALNAADGEMIAFADADDYFELDMLQQMYDAMEKYDADMISSGYYEEYPDKTDEHGTTGGTIVYNKLEAYQEYFRMGGRIGSGCWNKLVRAEALEDIRFKDYRLGEDVELLCRVLDNCNIIVCIEYAGYHYIHREDSATRSEFGPINLEILRISDEMLDYIKKMHPELTERMYAFHAAWYSAQIQVMHWQKDTRKYIDEKKKKKNRIAQNIKEYKNNPYIVRADRLFIQSYMLGLYRPVKWIYDFLYSMKKRRNG